MQRCVNWEETGRRIFAKRNSGVHFGRALSAAAEAQARASAQLDNLQVSWLPQAEASTCILLSNQEEEPGSRRHRLG